MTKNNPVNHEDLVLLVAIGRGDQQALGKLYDKYAPALTGIISRILYKDETDVILQHIFMLVWNEAGSFDASKHSPFTWLIKIARHAAIDKARSVQPEIRATTNSVCSCTDEKNEATGFTVPLEMHMFHLLYYKGLTCTEVATAMKLPADEIKKYIRMSIKNLEQIKV